MNRAEPAAKPSAADDRFEMHRPLDDESPRRALGQAAPKPAPVAPMARQGARPDTPSRSMQRAGPASSAEMSPAPGSAAAPAEVQAKEEEKDDHFAPAEPPEWIRRIRELRAQGNEKGARDLLDSFRAQYPDYVLPEDLRKFAEER